MRFLSLVTGAFLAAVSDPAHCQSVAERAASVTGSDLVIAFIGHCVQNARRFDKVETAAQLFDYQQLNGDQLLLLGPSAQDADMKGWLIDEGQAAPYLLGLSAGEVNGEAMEVCAVANPYIAADGVADALRDILQLRVPMSDEFDLGQRYRTWDMRQAASGASLTLMDAERMLGGGVTLSMTVPQEE